MPIFTALDFDFSSKFAQRLPLLPLLSSYHTFYLTSPSPKPLFRAQPSHGKIPSNSIPPSPEVQLSFKA